MGQETIHEGGCLCGAVRYREAAAPGAVGHCHCTMRRKASGAPVVTWAVSRNEILTALNEPDAFILAIVPVASGFASEPRYVRRPFQREPDFGATSVTYKLRDLLERSETPL